MAFSLTCTFEVEDDERMADQPLEPVSTEIFVPPDAQTHIPNGGPPVYMYQSNGLPCCSGCGCLALCLGVLLLTSAGSTIAGLVVLVTAFVLATSVMRLARVNRYSPNFAFIFVPLFLLSAQFASYVLRDHWMFTVPQFIGATAIIYAILWAGRQWGRR